MIQASQKFKEIMSSKFRPQSKVIIRLYNPKEQNTEEYTTYEWESKDIVDFEYERTADPLGRENSQIVFKWKERYKGFKNVYGEVSEYQGLKIGSKVELTIIQSLGFKTQWEELFHSNKKWKDVLADSKTWKSIFQNGVVEEIKLPTVFLYALPKYSGNIIQWEARDVLSFMNKKTLYYSLLENYNKPIAIGELAKWLMRNSYDFKATSDLKNTILKSVSNADILNYSYDIEACLIDENISDALRKAIFVFGAYHCDFNLDGSLKFKSLLIEDWFEKTNETIKKEIMYKEPNLIKPVGIIGANIKYYDYRPSYEAPITIKNTNWIGGYGEYTTSFDHPQYAVARDKAGNINYKLNSGGDLGNRYWYESLISTGLDTEYDYGRIELTLYPVKRISQIQSFGINGSGTTYEEDNNLNVIDPLKYRGDDRINAIFDYLSSKTTENLLEIPNMEITMLGNSLIETGDVYLVEATKKNNEKVFFPELVVYHKITYNGTIKSELKMHGMEVV